MNFTALKAQSNVRRCWSKTAGLRTRQVLEGTSKPAVLSCHVYLFNSTVLPDAFCFCKYKIEFFCQSVILRLGKFQETFHFSQLEKLLDIDSEFVALLKLEVRPYNNKDTIEEYRMVLYRLVTLDNLIQISHGSKPFIHNK